VLFIYLIGAQYKRWAEGNMTSAPTPSIIDTRRDQMFPTLEALEIERVRRFGKIRAFASTEKPAQVGRYQAA